MSIEIYEKFDAILSRDMKAIKLLSTIQLIEIKAPLFPHIFGSSKITTLILI